jgi:hypothetical protein
MLKSKVVCLLRQGMTNLVLFLGALLKIISKLGSISCRSLKGALKYNGYLVFP